MTFTSTTATVLVLTLTLAHYACLAAAAGPRVIIVGAGMSGTCTHHTILITVQLFY
jgi:hypothetical protein